MSTLTKFQELYEVLLRFEGGALKGAHALGTGLVCSLRQHRLARVEVSVEATVSQPRLTHDVRHARARVPAAANGARGGIENSLVRGFFTGLDESRHGGFRFV